MTQEALDTWAELEANLDAWLEVMDSSTYYELLGLLELADETAIQSAFHEFSGSFHPDQHRSAPERIRNKVEAVFRRGAEAYGVLRAPHRRQEYDLALARGLLRLGSTMRVGPRDGQSLSDLCRTPAARLFARRAEQHLDAGRLNDAQGALREAIRADGQNAALEERSEAIRALASLTS